jgi:outer membrane protein assembly factor BamB
MRNFKRAVLLTALASLLLCAVGVDSETGRPTQGGAPKRSSGGITLKRSPAPLGEYLGGRVPPLAVSADRLLVSAGDMLYMINGGREIVWSHSFDGNDVTGAAFDEKGTIYVSALNGILAALDTSGRKVWSNSLNGGDDYTQLECFGDGFLVVVNMCAYRGESETEDRLQYWKRGEVVWSKDFPPGAALHVWGDKIMAVTQTDDEVTLKEIP